MGSVVPRSGGGGGLERHSGRTGEDATGKAISYEHGGPVGWHRIPTSVRSGIEREAARFAAGTHPLRAARAALSEPVAAGSSGTTTKRRSDGSTYQSRRGWWCGSGLLVEVEVRRDLRARPDGRYEPAGDWVEHAVEWHRLVETTTKIRHYEVGAGAGGGGQAERTDDPLEAIPGSAAATVRVGLRGSDCWLTTGRRPRSVIGGFIVTETVTAYAVDRDRLVVIKAERTALTAGTDKPSADVLESAAWSVTLTRAGLEPLTPARATLAPARSTGAPRLTSRARRALGR